MAGSNKAKFISLRSGRSRTAGTTCLTNTITDLRPQGVPSAPDGRRGDELPAPHQPDTRRAPRPRSPRRSCSPSWLPPRSSSLPELGQTTGRSSQAQQLRTCDEAFVPVLELRSGRHAEHRRGHGPAHHRRSRSGPRRDGCSEARKRPRSRALLPSGYAAIEPNSHWTNNTTHDGTKFPSFTAGSYAAAMAEMDSFFQDLVVGAAPSRICSPATSGSSPRTPRRSTGSRLHGHHPDQGRAGRDERPGFLTRVGFLSTFAA